MTFVGGYTYDCFHWLYGMLLEMAGDFCDPVTLNIKSENCDEAIRPGEKRKRVNVPRIRDVTKVTFLNFILKYDS